MKPEMGPSHFLGKGATTPIFGGNSHSSIVGGGNRRLLVPLAGAYSFGPAKETSRLGTRRNRKGSIFAWQARQCFAFCGPAVRPKNLFLLVITSPRFLNVRVLSKPACDYSQNGPPLGRFSLPQAVDLESITMAGWEALLCRPPVLGRE